MKIILITGINGYIGSEAAKSLLKKDYKIIGFDLNSSNINYLAKNSNFKFFKADITDITTFPDELRNVDILIHCAALVHKRSRDLSRENYFRINHQGTKNILSFLDKKRLKLIIFLSTVSIYGALAHEMIPDENTPPSPDDYYGESKLAAENEIQEFSKNNSIPFTILRLAPVYGENFLLNINKRIYFPKKIFFYKISSGKQRISLCSIHNVIDVISYNIDRNNHLNKIYIVKDTEDYTINEIINIFKETFAQEHKPVIKIPYLIPETFSEIIDFLLPQKGKFYKHQIRKILKDSIYSGKKVHTTGIQFKWNLKNTLSNPTRYFKN
ncbi:MAG: NAD-dependent epimerase/dehydratase family protein [Candidatus Hodarchaeota archaeon]